MAICSRPELGSLIVLTVLRHLPSLFTFPGHDAQLCIRVLLILLFRPTRIYDDADAASSHHLLGLCSCGALKEVALASVDA